MGTGLSSQGSCLGTRPWTEKVNKKIPSKALFHPQRFPATVESGKLHLSLQTIQFRCVNHPKKAHFTLKPQLLAALLHHPRSSLEFYLYYHTRTNLWSWLECQQVFPLIPFSYGTTQSRFNTACGDHVSFVCSSLHTSLGTFFLTQKDGNLHFRKSCLSLIDLAWLWPLESTSLCRWRSVECWTALLLMHLQFA